MIPQYNHITERELEILNQISLGLSSEEIAKKLSISAHTVKVHRRTLLFKLNARNTAHLVRRGFELGLIHFDGLSDNSG